MIGKAIYARLTAAQQGDLGTQTAALAALASLIGKRVYPEISDQNLYPLVIYQVKQEEEDSITPMVAKEFTVTITMVARGQAAYGTAQTIKTNVRLLLDRQGSLAGGTDGWGGIQVRGFYLQPDDEAVEPDSGNPDDLFYEISDAYRVWAAA